jgi:hypothetical protein
MHPFPRLKHKSFILEDTEREGIMQIVTRWTEQGRTEEAQSLILRQLSRRMGTLPLALKLKSKL